jgi:hypothetical protein
MNFKRHHPLRKIKFSSVGILACVLSILVTLGDTIQTVFYYGNSDYSIMELIFVVINLIFYFYLLKIFMSSENSRGSGYLAMFILSLVNYIFPFFYYIFLIIINGMLDGDLISTLISMLTLGLSFSLAIIYFILMNRQAKNKGKDHFVVMEVIGALIALFSLINFISVFVFTDFGTEVSTIVSAIFTVLEYFTNFLFSFLFLLYPFYYKKF